MKYTSLLFAALTVVAASYTPAVSLAINTGATQILADNAQGITASENKGPRKPKKFKKKSHPHNKKHGKRK